MANHIHNPMCDGSHCVSSTGIVRTYRLGGAGNLILCRACWEHENRFNRQRAIETGNPENWKTQDWNTAEIYGNQE